MSAEQRATGSDLPVHRCWELLRDAAYGRLSVVTADGPMIFPVNAYIDHGALVFRSASGEKLDAIRSDPRVAFEIDGYDEIAGTAWSVIIRGTAAIVSHQFEAVHVAELGVTPWQGGDKPTYVRVDPTSVTGRMFERVSADQWLVTPPVPGRISPDE